MDYRPPPQDLRPKHLPPQDLRPQHLPPQVLELDGVLTKNLRKLVYQEFKHLTAKSSQMTQSRLLGLEQQVRDLMNRVSYLEGKIRGYEDPPNEDSPKRPRKMSARYDGRSIDDSPKRTHKMSPRYDDL